MSQARSRSQSSMQRSFASSVLPEPELVDYARIEKPVVANTKISSFLTKTMAEIGAANYQTALQSIEQTMGQIKECPMSSDRSSFLLTLCHLNIFTCYLKIGGLADAEVALERAKNVISIERNIANEEFQALYVRILVSYVILRFQQEDVEGLAEAKDVIADFLASQDNPSNNLPVFMWSMGVLFGTESFQNADAQTAKITKLFHGFHLEFSEAADKAKEEYYDFVQVAKNDKLNELLLIALKRLMILESESPASLGKLQDFFRENWEKFVAEIPDFSTRFQKFEIMFETLTELACLFQLAEAQRADPIANFTEQLNPELIRAISKFILRQLLVKMRGASVGGSRPQDQGQSQPPRLTFGLPPQQDPRQAASKSVVQTGPRTEKPVMSEFEYIRQENQKEPWIHLEPLRVLVAGQRPVSKPVSTLPPAAGAASDDPIEVIQQTIRQISNEKSVAVLSTLARQPIFRSSIESYERAVDGLVTACNRILIHQPYLAIIAVARIRNWRARTDGRQPGPGIPNPNLKSGQNAPGSYFATSSGVQAPGQQSQIGPDGRPLPPSTIRPNNSQIGRPPSEYNTSMIPATFLGLPEQLTKLNYSSSGKMIKYFILLGGNNLRWADKPEHLPNPKLCHTIPLATIRGVTYGRVTKTFFKSGNKKLESWLCFSIILAKKSVDLYASEERINAWMIRLSGLVKSCNPTAYCLRPGKFLWRKMKFLLEYCVVAQIPEEQLKKFKRGISFCRLLLLYKIFEKNAQKQGVQPPRATIRK